MDKWAGQQVLEGQVAVGQLGGWQGRGRLGEWWTESPENEPVDVTEPSVLLHSLSTCWLSLQCSLHQPAPGLPGF